MSASGGNYPGDIIASSAPASENTPAVAYTNPEQAKELEEEGAVAPAGLAGYIRAAWGRNKRVRDAIDIRLLECLRARRGKYNTTDLSIYTIGAVAPPYLPISAMKMRAAEAALLELVIPEHERAFGIDATPLPSLPKELEAAVNEAAKAQAQAAMQQQAQAGQGTMSHGEFVLKMQQLRDQIYDAKLESEREIAKDRARRMEDKIADRMDEGNYEHAMREFINLYCTYPAAVLEGPYTKMQRKLKWGKNPAKPDVVNEPTMAWSAINPFDVYPAPQAKDCQDGDFIVRKRFTRSQMYQMIGLPGYDEAAIRRVLENQSSGGLASFLEVDAARRSIEGISNNIWKPEYIIDALHFWGSVQGKDLIAQGVEVGNVDPIGYYEVDAILIGNEVIRCEINDDPLGRRPYRKAAFDEVPGAFWGNSLYELMQDAQSMANACFRALNSNMGLACVTGDTVVYRHSKAGRVKGKNSRIGKRGRTETEVTVRQLWESRKTAGRNRLRSLNEATGEFFGNKLVDVLFNGVRPVYQVTTKAGYKIKATMDHLFYDDRGAWKPLEIFSVGDLIGVNGSVAPLTKVCLDCGDTLKAPNAVRCRSCNGSSRKKPKHCLDCNKPFSQWTSAVRCTDCKKNSPGTIARLARQKAEAAINMDVTDTTLMHRARKLVKPQCEMCPSTDRLEVHHMDRDHSNYRPENIKTLCHKCHNWSHMRYDHFGDGYGHVWLDYDVITSVEYVGEEEVFDLQMEAPNHNFIANGFVVHNCGPIVGVDMSKLAAGEDPKALRPLDVLQLDTQRSSNQDATKALIFFQADDRAPTLTSLIEFFMKMADDLTGFPRYMAGDGTQLGGAGETMGGLSLMISNAEKGLKKCVTTIDTQVISPTVFDAYVWEMLYGDDPEIKGDCFVVPGGAAAILVKERIQDARIKFLQMTANPLDQQIIGPDRRAKMIREVGRVLHMAPNDIAPSEEEMKAKMSTPPPPPQPKPDTVLKVQGDLQRQKMQDDSKERIAGAHVAASMMKEGAIHPEAAAMFKSYLNKQANAAYNEQAQSASPTQGAP